MFKPTIQLSLAKNKKASEKASVETSVPTTEYLKILREFSKDAVIATAVVIGSYIVLDTLRQVVVNNTNPSNK